MTSLRLNSIIPNFVANTTVGKIDFYDYVGDSLVFLLYFNFFTSNFMRNNDLYFLTLSWSILFSHPLDFTPVCTTELGRIVYQFDEFKKRNVKVIGLSCDEVSSHVRWIHVSLYKVPWYAHLIL